MDVVGVLAAYLPVVRVCTALSREALSASLDSAVRPCQRTRQNHYCNFSQALYKAL